MKTDRIDRIITEQRKSIEIIQTQLATEFEIPAQRIINLGMNRMGIDRFDRDGNDVWEMVVCRINGWDYEKPPAHLTSRWASY